MRHAARSADDFAAAIALERNARTVRGKAVVSVGEGSPQPTLPRRARAS